MHQYSIVIIWTTLASYICILSRIINFTLWLYQYIHKSTIYISLSFNLWYNSFFFSQYMYNQTRWHKGCMMINVHRWGSCCYVHVLYFPLISTRLFVICIENDISNFKCTYCTVCPKHSDFIYLFIVIMVQSQADKKDIKKGLVWDVSVVPQMSWLIIYSSGSQMLQWLTGSSSTWE